LISASAAPNALTVLLFSKSDMSKVLSSATALAASSSASKVFLNVLVKMSRSEAIFLSRLSGVDVRLERIEVLDSYSRFLEGSEFVGQKAAETNNGDCLVPERPANVADFLHELHITFWQSDIGRPL
jgi:hypothetical protein